MSINVNTTYSLDINHPTYMGERDYLLKVAENNPLRLFGLGLGGDNSGLSIGHDSLKPPHPIIG